MPDTGEDREIKRRIDAREAELVSESKKLLRQSKARAKAFEVSDKKRGKKRNIQGRSGGK